MKKRIISLLLCVLLCLSLLPTAFAANATGGGIDRPVKYNITILDDGYGTAKADKVTAAAGETVTLTVTPNKGYRFWNWRAENANTFNYLTVSANNTFIMPAYDVALRAIFVVDTYGITVKSDGNGVAFANVTNAAWGDAVTLTAIPNRGYHFKRWQSDDVTVYNNAFIMPNKAVTIKAIFEADFTEYTIHFNANGGKESVADMTTEGQTLPSLPSAKRRGYTFEGWYTAASGGTRITTATVFFGETTVYAQWTSDGGGKGHKHETYTVTVQSGIKNGDVTTNVKNSAKSGKNVKLTVTPDKGYTLKTLTVIDENGNEVNIKKNNKRNYFFDMPASDVTVWATFMVDNTCSCGHGKD